MGIQPTHKGFANLLSATLTLIESIQTPNFPLIRDTFRVTPVGRTAGAWTTPRQIQGDGWEHLPRV